MYKWINITTNADYELLTGLIDSEFSPKEVASRLAERISTAVKGVLVEYNYVDKDYRSTYYHFYAKKGQRYRSDCVRLHFFDGAAQFDDKNYALTPANGSLGDHYFGYMVLRPTGIATVGRSLLSPDISRAKGRVMQAAHKVHVLGERLEVNGFPSMDQHNDISVCAHAAC